MAVSNQTFAQGEFERAPDPVAGGELYRGNVTFEDLGNFNWQTEGYQNYQPNSEVIASLRQHLTGYEVTVFLGTWCEDSHLLLPQLQKILEAAGYPLETVKMIAVDRLKTSPEGLEKQYNIQFVPSIILSRDGREQGRIVENAYPSLEKMMMDILEKGK